MSEIIRLNAKNDTNGNPRRVFIEINDGVIIGAWDEGYEGRGVLPDGKKWLGLSIETTPSEYNGLITVD